LLTRSRRADTDYATSERDVKRARRARDADYATSEGCCGAHVASVQQHMLRGHVALLTKSRRADMDCSHDSVLSNPPFQPRHGDRYKEIDELSRRTSRSQYRVRYGQPLGNDGVFVDLTVVLFVISATTASRACFPRRLFKNRGLG
jgi:hypothetical protein